MSGFGVFLLTGLLLVSAATVLFAVLIWRSARPHSEGVAESPQSGGDQEAVSGADALPESGPSSANDALGAFYKYQLAANDPVPRAVPPP